ncbi:hypothetical protein ABEB36_001574 [Hypothenemus hampei]|uniref:Odorant receptor n=1 Tax=Hypothenemus hampei TaxID=57062 RepID=A0ABD1FF28_HYPHA
MDASKRAINDDRSILKHLRKQMIVGGFLPCFKIENWFLQKIYKCYVHSLGLCYITIVALMCFDFICILPRGDMEKFTLNTSFLIPSILIIVKLFILKSGNAIKLLNTIIEEEHKIFSCESISIRNIYYSFVTYAQNCTKMFNIISLLSGSAVVIIMSLSGLFIEHLQKPVLILDQLSFNEFNKQNHYGTYLIIQNIWAVLATLLVNDVNRALKWWLLVEFALNSISIGSVIIQIIVASHTSFFGILVMVVINLFIQQFILAWFANDVAVESVRISESIYSLEWYKASTNIQILFKVAILRSQKPLFIYLGNFKPLTIQTSLSVSYLYTYVIVLL